MEVIVITSSVAITTGLYGLWKGIKYFYKHSNVNCKSSCQIENISEKDSDDGKNE